MPVVTYKISIGSSTIEAGSDNSLFELETSSSFAVPVNSCVMEFDAAADLDPAVDDAVKVEIGVDDATEQVFAGLVRSVSAGPQSIRVVAESSFSALVSTWHNRAYEGKSVADVVKDIAGELSISTGTVEGTVTFPSLLLYQGRNLWQHLKRLADYCGVGLHADVEDKLVCQAPASGSELTLGHGSEILNYEVEQLPPPIDGVEVFGDSPSGRGQGDDASSWLAKEELKGSDGGTKNVLRIFEPAARTPDLAGEIAKNVLALSQVTRRGTVTTNQGQAIALDDKVKLVDLPVSSHNGSYRVVGVNHLLNLESGFTTTVSWEETA